jgi:two-component system phosphate regulon sensor histidine kinase PhoR
MHRIAFKIAAFTGLGMVVVGITAALFGSLSFTYPILTALAAGVVAYVVAQRQLAIRLRRVQVILDGMRRDAGRMDETHSANGDELDALLRRADQTSTAIRKRIETMSSAEAHRREYLGDVSHELKTPIFAIQGFAETLISGALDDKAVRRGFVEKILQNTHRLDALATNLTEISGLESGAFQLTPSEFGVRQLFDEVRDSLEMSAQQKGIKLQIDVGPDVTRVTADRDRIRQVLGNLVDNAIKYNNQDGWVKLSAESLPPKFVRLSVQDNGIGIAAEDLTRVTERFFRADRSRSRDRGGTGLGLSIVKHILTAHDTRIEIHSIVGRGSIFSFTLPVEGSVIEITSRSSMLST